MRVFGLVVLCAIAALGHTWLDCADWRFNNPSQDPKTGGFAEGEGFCAGYARRFPKARRDFGSHDSYTWFRHYLQAKPFSTANSNLAAPCNPFNQLGADGRTKVGGDERRGNPISLAYGPNKDQDGYEFGGMTKVTAGQKICWRWPAKNHKEHVQPNGLNNKVFVNWAPNAGEDISQLQFNQNNIVNLTYNNCPKPGIASAGDQNYPGSDRMGCGGCFDVPAKSAGVYTVQWRWMLNEGEWYTSCADIEVAGSAIPTSRAPTPTSRPSVSPTPPTQAPPPPANTVPIKVYVTAIVPGAPDSFDVAAFVGKIARILNIPTSAILEVGIKLDQSTSTSTNIQFILGNVNGVDPVKAATQLKNLAEQQSSAIIDEDLRGMVIVIGETSAATTVVASFVLALLLALLF
jgi:hypothetical protein